MKLLVLGGTKFLGRHLVESALARGHKITLFNRGQTNPELFPEVEKLLGNRDGDLRALENRKWDAVIDTSGFVSTKVRAAAQLLADSVGHYAFVSSVSVYQDFSKPGLDETAPVEQLAAGGHEDERNTETYGARKALCELAAEAVMPGRVLQVRAGLLVGPHDGTGRFLYWVRRAAQGGEVLAPGNPDAPVQFIDARDLAAWIIKMVESGRAGVFNATGPASPMTFRHLLDQCNAAGGGGARMTWVDERFLLEQGVTPWTEIPLWLPEKTQRAFFGIDCGRALDSGLQFRPLTETLQATMEWDRAAGRPGAPCLDPNREQALLRAWKQRPIG